MADFLNAADPREIVFGANMTTLTFAFSRAIGRTLKPGDEIVVTALDHDGNIAPWLALQEERGVVVRMANFDPATCTLDMDDLRGKINEKTKLVAVGYASNAVGTINDVTTVIGWAREVGALSFVDAVQFAPHGPIDVQALGCDFLVCSAYKFFGPHLGIALWTPAAAGIHRGVQGAPGAGHAAVQVGDGHAQSRMPRGSGRRARVHRRSGTSFHRPVRRDLP